MTPRQLIATAVVPDGDELRLFRRGDDFMIVLGNNELMSSRMSGSEIALAELTCARIGSRAEPHVLIGGYGMGFTLRAALGVLPKGSSVTVAELVPEVISWGRGPMAEPTRGCLDDQRVKITEDDVAALNARRPPRSTHISTSNPLRTPVLLRGGNSPAVSIYAGNNTPAHGF